MVVAAEKGGGGGLLAETVGGMIVLIASARRPVLAAVTAAVIVIRVVTGVVIMTKVVNETVTAVVVAKRQKRTNKAGDGVHVMSEGKRVGEQRKMRRNPVRIEGVGKSGSGRPLAREIPLAIAAGTGITIGSGTDGTTDDGTTDLVPAAQRPRGRVLGTRTGKSGRRGVKTARGDAADQKPPLPSDPAAFAGGARARSIVVDVALIISPSFVFIFC
eukprot:Rmarinus@m.27957